MISFDSYEDALAYSTQFGIAVFSDGESFAIAEDQEDLEEMKKNGFEFYEE